MTTSSTGRMAEHLVCAELARPPRHLIATTFTHNIPKFDVLVTDEHCHTIPIQVKGTNSDSWQSSADDWMEIEYDETKQTQAIAWERPSATEDIIWVCVAIKPVGDPQQRDQFFILTEREIKSICISNYREMLEKCNFHRKRNWKSLSCWWSTEELAPFEDKWETIEDRLKSAKPEMASNGQPTIAQPIG